MVQYNIGKASHLAILVSTRACGLRSPELEALARIADIDSAGSVHLVSIAVSSAEGAGEEVAAVVAQMEAAVDEAEPSAAGPGAGVGAVRRGEAQGARGVDVDLLATRHCHVQGEGAARAALGEDGTVGEAGAVDAAHVGTVARGAPVQQDARAVGVDRGVLDI